MNTMHTSDIEIAQGATMLPIGEVARRAGLPEGMLEPYGRTKAKVDVHSLGDLPQRGKRPQARARPPLRLGWRMP